MDKGATMVAGIHDGGRGESGKNVLTCDIEAGEESPGGRIAVNEGGENMGYVIENGAKREDEQMYECQAAKVEAEEWSWHEMELGCESSVFVFFVSVYGSPSCGLLLFNCDPPLFNRSK